MRPTIAAALAALLGLALPAAAQRAFVLDANMKVLLRFSETADQYVPYLLRKAEHIDDYLQS